MEQPGAGMSQPDIVVQTSPPASYALAKQLRVFFKQSKGFFDLKVVYTYFRSRSALHETADSEIARFS